MPKNHTEPLRNQDMLFEAPSIEILAKHISNFREANGLTQQAFAEMCHLHRTYIGSIERLERDVSLSTLEAIAKTIGIPLFLLFIPYNLNNANKIPPPPPPPTHTARKNKGG
jgi:transcriptional regulator with XRE-family HTH domain